MFVKRNAAGDICAVSVESEGVIDEFVESNSQELACFLDHHKPQVKQSLEHSDMQMMRVIDDVVNLLINKNLIQFTELPVAAQQKLMSRREMRGQFKGVDLLSDEDDITLQVFKWLCNEMNE